MRANANPSRVWLEYDLFQGDTGSGPAWVTVNTTDAQLASNQTKTDSAYELWSVELSSLALASSATQEVNIAADIGGQKVSTSSFAVFTFPHC